MRKNVIDDRFYMINQHELYEINLETSEEFKQLDALISAIKEYQMKNRRSITEFAVKASPETNLIIEKSLGNFYDEDAYITAEEVVRAYVHSIKDDDISKFTTFQSVQDSIKNLVKLGVSGELVELKKAYSYMGTGVFDYIKEYGHYSFEDDVDERVEFDKDILLYENGSFKEVKIGIETLKLSN